MFLYLLMTNVSILNVSDKFSQLLNCTSGVAVTFTGIPSATFLNPHLITPCFYCEPINASSYRDSCAVIRTLRNTEFYAQKTELKFKSVFAKLCLSRTRCGYSISDNGWIKIPTTRCGHYYGRVVVYNFCHWANPRWLVVYAMLNGAHYENHLAPESILSTP